MLTIAPHSAPAAAPGVVRDFMDYCLNAIATADPLGPRAPDGAEVSEKGAILVEQRLAHFALKRDSRDDWVCELGEKSAKITAKSAEDFLASVNTVDKYRSTFGENPYLAATVCVGPNAVAMIVNGPLSDELNIGTAVFSGGMVSEGCSQ